MRPSAIMAAWLACALAAGIRLAAAQEAPAPPPPRVFYVPTAWLQPDREVYASAGVDHKRRPFTAVSVGLAGLAELDLTLTGVTERVLPTALFKIGWGGRRAAAALGFRKLFGRTDVTAEMFGGLSGALGPIRLHLGGALWDAESAAGVGLAAHLRPFGGIEWTPGLYPRSTLLADVEWVPRFRTAVELAWVAGGGVRYQAMSWLSVELGVEVRQGEKLTNPAVFVRVNVARRRPR